MKMNKFDPAKKVAVIKEVKALLEGFNLVQVGVLMSLFFRFFFFFTSKEVVENRL